MAESLVNHSRFNAIALNYCGGVKIISKFNDFKKSALLQPF